jgi:RNA polymerase sigma-70 factor (ECF subfamily)
MTAATTARSDWSPVERDRERDEALVSPLPQAAHDGVLVVRARQGDRWAIEALYRRHVHRVTGLVTRLMRGGAEVEDVVQDTFVDAFRGLTRLAEPSLFSAWLMRIAVHQAHRRFRRRRLLGLFGLRASIEDEPLGRSLALGAPQEVVAECAALDRVLAQVEPRDRAAWLLHRIEGYSLPEVGHLVGASLSTVKRRVARAEAVVATLVAEASR